VTRGRGSKGKLANGVGSHYSHTTSERGVLLTLLRTSRLPVFDLTDAPHRFKWTRPFGERRNLVSVRVPSRFKRSLTTPEIYTYIQIPWELVEDPLESAEQTLRTTGLEYVPALSLFYIRVYPTPGIQIKYYAGQKNNSEVQVEPLFM
jgi:hypothetical protein